MKELDDLRDILDTEIEKIIKEVVDSMFITLVPSTPKLTGWARAGWMISTTLPQFVPVGSKTNVSVAEAAQKDSLSRFLHKSLDNIGTIYISNAVPYISILNTGTSDQAPKDFVKKSVQKGMHILSTKRVIK